MKREEKSKRVVGIRYPDWSSFGPETMAGVVDYMQDSEDWRLVTGNKSLGELETVNIDADLECDGVILFRATEAELAAFRKRGIAVVLTSTEGPEGGFPRVVPDNDEIGRMAALHLIERNLSHFAFIGRGAIFYEEEEYAPGFRVYPRQRFAGFAAELENYGFKPDVSFLKGHPLWEPDAWRKVQAETMEFLKTLPTPCGLFVADDSLGAVVMRAAEALRIDVPGSLAIIAYGNDPAFCYMAHPSMSSIDHPARAIGTAAAELLNRQFAGEKLGDLVQTIPSGGIVPRTSSDTLSIQDPRIRELVTWIRRRAPFDSILVSDLARRSQLSLTTLKGCFAQELGCSPKHEIQRVRLGHLKHLLGTTDESLSVIAAKMGFSSSRDLARFFTRETGIRPARYRKETAGKT